MRISKLRSRSIAGVFSKRNYEVAAALAVVACGIGTAYASSTTTSVVITDWTFETTAPGGTAGILVTGSTTTPAITPSFAPEIGTGSAFGEHFPPPSGTVAATVTYSSPVGNGSGHAFSANNWNVNDFYQFSTSTNTGTTYAGITVSWDQTSSNTGPQNFLLQYSTDGTSFTTAQTYTTDPTPNAIGSFSGTTVNPALTHTFDFTSVPTLNATTVFFRLVDANTTSATGGTVASTGTDRVDNFIVSGLITVNNITWLGGNGEWNTTAKVWSTDGSTQDTIWNNTTIGPSSIAVFGTSNSITVNSAGVTADGLSFLSGANGTSIAGPGAITLVGNTISVDPASTVTLAAPIAGNVGISVAGGGTVILGSTTSNFTGNASVSAGVLRISNPLNLGCSTAVTIAGNGTLRLDAPMTIAEPVNVSGTGAGLDDQGNNVTITTLTGGGSFTKTNTGTLTLPTTSSPTQPAFTGTLVIGAGTVVLNSVSSIGLSGMGTGTVQVQNGGTLAIDATPAGGNLTVGISTNAGKIPGFMDIFSGGTILATGNVTWASGNFGTTGAPTGTPFTATLNNNGGGNVQGTYTLATANANSTLTFQIPYRQFDTLATLAAQTTAAGNAARSIDPFPYYSHSILDGSVLMTTHVTGGGRVILSDGDIGTSNTAYGGDWSVDNGSLQVGPFYDNTSPSSTSTSTTQWNGPRGQPLNALGFYTPQGSGSLTSGCFTPNSDPDLPNTVFLNTGGTLVIAVDQLNKDNPTDPNGNPLITSATASGYSVNPTPSYIRNSIVLQGGSIAASGQEVTFSATNIGAPDGVLVKAKFGGNFTVTSTGGKVDLFDPDNPASTVGREVDLVGGNRTITVASPGFPNASVGSPVTLNYSTAWAGNLVVSAGGTTGGVFDIARTSTGAGITVTPGASISVTANATLQLDGIAALTDGSNTVAIANSGQFTVATGTQTVGAITGSGGNTTVALGATLTAPSINQSGVTVNGLATFTSGASAVGSLSGTGTATVNSGATFSSGPITVNALVANGNVSILHATTRVLSKVNSLSVGGSLDITNSRVVVEDTSAGRLTDITNYKNQVLSNTILSSTAAGEGQVVVVSDNAVRLGAFGAAASNFGTGIANVDSSSILITTAVLGDANLDGVVDIKDLQDLANHWQQPATDWSQADFDGNGVVALQDLQALANHWQNGVGAPGQGSGESFSDALSLVGQFGGTSAVPEPASLALLGLGGVVLASRRRNKR